jgi:hypothetical protein
MQQYALNNTQRSNHCTCNARMHTDAGWQLDGGEGTRAQKDNETLKGETAALKAEVTIYICTSYLPQYAYCAVRKMVLKMCIYSPRDSYSQQFAFVC